MSLKRVLLVLFLLSSALAGGADGGWRTLDGIPSAASSPRPCPPLQLPPAWDVRSSVYADVTGDGVPECVLSVWRPWRDWPIARWSSTETPITGNHDAGGLSSHVAVLKATGDGQYRNVWVGSALYQPVTALTVLPSGRLLTLETTYGRGRNSVSMALSEWVWTGFGFRLERRVTVQARQVGVDALGRVIVR